MASQAAKELASKGLGGSTQLRKRDGFSQSGGARAGRTAGPPGYFGGASLEQRLVRQIGDDHNAGQASSRRLRPPSKYRNLRELSQGIDIQDRFGVFGFAQTTNQQSVASRHNSSIPRQPNHPSQVLPRDRDQRSDSDSHIQIARRLMYTGAGAGSGAGARSLHSPIPSPPQRGSASPVLARFNSSERKKSRRVLNAGRNMGAVAKSKKSFRDKFMNPSRKKY